MREEGAPKGWHTPRPGESQPLPNPRARRPRSALPGFRQIIRIGIISLQNPAKQPSFSSYFDVLTQTQTIDGHGRNPAGIANPRTIALLISTSLLLVLPFAASAASSDLSPTVATWPMFRGGPGLLG